MQLIIFDDQLLFSEALGSLLAKRGHEIFGCPSTFDELLFLMEHRQPDACLLNVRFTNAETIEEIGLVNEIAPNVALLVLAEEPDLSLLSRAMDAGANGACLKTDGVDEIERVLNQAVMTHRAARSDANKFAWSRGALALARPRTLRNNEMVTPRERAVLELLIRGASTTAIASELMVGAATIRTHLQHLFNKFGVHSRLALVACAVRSGVIQVDGETSYLAQSS